MSLFVFVFGAELLVVDKVDADVIGKDDDDDEAI